MMSKKTSIVPYGWKRIIEKSSSPACSVTYISPSGAVLSSIVEVCQYLEKDDTCKCGLQCPIHVPKVFSFNPEVQSINLTQKEWCQQENKTESHRKNCQHWNKLQKTQIGKKKAPCHSELTIEPPPKLIIIRKDGQLRSVIPDKLKAPAGVKKSAGKDIKLPLSPSSATSAASRKSSTTSLKSPLFESGLSVSAPGTTKDPAKSKSDFKLQWIKADDELSQNEGESGNELCFSPDLKKSPPMPFSQSLIPGLSSPPSLFKQEGQFAMPNMVNQRALFMQGGTNTGLPSLHGGVEPVHRFGMSAFPGTNFVLKSDAGSAGVAHNSFPQEIPRHPLMAVKSEQGQQFNQPSHFGFPTSMAQSQSKRFVQPGTMQEPHGGMLWQQNQNSQLTGNLKQMNSNISGMRPRAQLKSPTRQPGPQQFALGSPTMLNPTSPYGFQMGNSGQNASLMSPGQSTDPSPFSSRPLSRSSSIGTPAPSPGGHWQGPRPQIPDYSRPHSRSSNATTPGPETSPSQITQWNPGTANPAIYPARNPGTVRGFAPNLSPGPGSPFSPSRLAQSSNSSRLPMNLQGPRGEIPHHGFPMNQSASQQLRFHSQNVQQRAQQGKNGQPLPYQPPQSHFGATAQLRGLVPPSISADQNSPGMQGNMFRPCPPYRPARIQFARINETDSGGNQPRFPFRPTQPQIRNMQYQGQVMQQRFPFDHQQYGQFHGPLPTIRPRQYVPGIMNPRLGKPMGQSVQPAQTKPKRTRRKKTKQPVVKKSEPQQALNTNFMSAEFPDLFGPTHIQHDITAKITSAAVCASGYPSNSLHNADLMKTSSQLPLATRTVTTPNLVMPTGMPDSQPNQAENTDEKPSALRPVGADSLAVVGSQPGLPGPTESLNAQKDPGRGVTTPPLPVLSPTCLFEEAHKEDDDDDFSDFASPSPAVFDFPISVASTVRDTNVKKTVVSSSPASVKVTCSSSTSVSTANAIPTPILSTMIKQSVAIGAKAVNESTMAGGIPYTSLASSHSSTQAKLCSVQYDPQKSHSVSRDSTTLVSSSGKIFHLPRKSSSNSLRRRHSDQGHDHSTATALDLSMRRRLRSDPYPSLTIHSSKHDNLLRSALSTFTRSDHNTGNQPVKEQPSNTQSLPPCSSEHPSSISTVTEPTGKESEPNGMGSVIATVRDVPAECLSSQASSSNDIASTTTNEHIEAVMTDSSTVSAKIAKKRLHSAVGDSLLRDANSEDNVIPPVTTAVISSSIDDAKSVQSTPPASEPREPQLSNQPPVDVIASACVQPQIITPELNLESGSPGPNSSKPTDMKMEESVSSGQNSTELVTVESGSSGPTENEQTEEIKPDLPNKELPNVTEMKEKGDIEISDEVGDAEEKSDRTFVGDIEEKDMQVSENTKPPTASKFIENSQGGETGDKPMQTRQTSFDNVVDDIDKLDKVSESKEFAVAVNIATVMEASDNPACEDSSVDSQEKETCEDAAKYGENIAKDLSPPLQALEHNGNTEMEVDASSQECCVNPQSASDSPIAQCAVESDEKERRVSGDVLSSPTSPKCQHEEIGENASNPSIKALEAKNTDENIDQTAADCHQSDDESDAPKSGDVTASVNEQHVHGNASIVSPSASCEIDNDAPSAIIHDTTFPEQMLVHDEDCNAGDSTQEPGSRKFEEHIPETDTRTSNSDSDKITQLQFDEEVDDQKSTDDTDKSDSALVDANESSDFTQCQDEVDVSERTAEPTLPTSSDGCESLAEIQVVEAGKSDQSAEIQSCPISADISEETSNIPSITENCGEEGNTIVTTYSESATESDKVEDESLTRDHVLAVEIPEKREVKSETEASEIAVEQTNCLLKDPAVTRLITSSASQTQFNPLSGVAISSDLTNTVIRQLSNYNTFLKNLLVSGVVDPTTIAQLTSAASEQDENQIKVLTALINNPMQRFKEENSDNPQLVCSSKHQHGTHFADGEGAPSTSRIPQVITEIREKPSTQVTSASPVSEQITELMSEATSGDLATTVSSQAAAHSDSPNHGLQVPIVSSSVKGSSHSEEEDLEHRTEISTAASTGKQKTAVQDEVSTSIKGSDSVRKQTLPEAIVIAQNILPEKRRARTRNTTSKQYTKRLERGDTSEKSTKRSSGSTSSSSNLRVAQRGSGSSERQSRNVKSGDLVWGQMRGFPSWPGKVVKPSEVRGLQQRAPLSEGKVWVKWFGDHTFTQMNPADLVSMTEGLEAHHRSRKKGRTRTRKISAHLETAIQEAVDELEQQQGSVKKSQVSLVPVIPIVSQPTTLEAPEKPRRGRKRKAT